MGVNWTQEMLKDQAHSRDLKEEEIHTKTNSILEDVKRLQERRASLPEGSPELANIDKSLAAHQQAFTDLYHPTKNPNAFQHLGRFLEKHVARKEPKPLPKSNAVTPERMAGLQSSAAGTSQNPFELKKRSLMATGVSEEEATRLATGQKEPKPEAENWVTSDVTFADGTKATLQHNTKSGVWTDLAGNPVPKERLSTASVAPKAAGKDKYAWTKKNGKFVSVKLDANGQIIPGSENPNILPPASLTGRISTGQYHFVDEKGQVHEVQETRSSMPAGQGNVVPKTPGEAKGRVKTPESRDKVVGFKGNKDYADTKSSYEGAVDRAKTMDQNLTNALNGDQQAMLSLVANHIGMTLGAQKGARITRAVWDEAVSSTPWLQKIAAKWSDDGYLSGVTLAPEQMRQMVRLGHEKVHTLKEHLDRLNAERTDPGAPNKAAGGTQSSGKAVSLAAARKLRSMKGKTDEEITAAIKAAGHEVGP